MLPLDRIGYATTPALRIAYLELGSPSGHPVVLLHGWPSDVQDWSGVAPALADRGFRVIVPWLRGCGPTHFIDGHGPKSGQQAAIGVDLRNLIEVLELDRPILAGYDWGGRAACIVAALWPELISGLVSIGGYAIQNLERMRAPLEPDRELRYWYQWYLNTARGVLALERDRRALARLLWQLWSPNWAFAASTFEATAQSLDNPDWVEVTAHSYRHRHGNALGDPALEPIEEALKGSPPIAVPTVVLHGACDGVEPPEHDDTLREQYRSSYQRRIIATVGHFLSREAPEAVVDAILQVGV